jgi:hypothetical protein
MSATAAADGAQFRRLINAYKAADARTSRLDEEMDKALYSSDVWKTLFAEHTRTCQKRMDICLQLAKAPVADLHETAEKVAILFAIFESMGDFEQDAFEPGQTDDKLLMASIARDLKVLGIAS